MLSQQTTFLETEDLKTSKHENECLKANDKSLKSKEKRQKIFQVFNFSDSQVQYYESQIRLADSLYKNYLPQYNFDEVKKAVDFFEKSPSLRVSKSPSRDDSNNSVTWRLSDLNFLHARAHYYHAVGLTERDDVAGACEHYLKALEIMEIELETENLKTSKSEKRPKSKDKSLKSKEKREKVSVAEPVEAPSDDVVPSTSSGTACSKTVDSCPLSVDNPQDYEKLRFLSLIYTRLGELFLSENYCDLAFTKYRKALKYKLLLRENKAVANTYKCLGNSYQLYNMPDSALYYYNKSLETNCELPNRLDVEKCIAQILFDRGEKDSAYRLINNNLSKLEGYVAKYSYYQILGEMYHRDNLYDSAIKYLNLSMYATNKHTILTSSNILAAIYDSIGNMNHKFFYDSISISILNSNHNKSIYTAKLQNVYSEYANRKQDREIEKEKIESRKLFIKYLIIALSSILVLVTIIFVLRHRQRKDKKMYDEKIFNMNSEIDEKNVEIENGKKTISVINSELESITKKYDKLSNDYISEKKKFEKTLSRKITKNDIRKFCNCENSKRILTNIDDIKNRGLKINNLATLTKEELKQLLEDADNYLNEFTATITNKYPKLNEEDLYCICLLLLNIKGPTIAALLGKEYNSVWSRIKKIYSIIGINSKENLHKIFY